MIGDKLDTFKRLKTLIPFSWFGDNSTNIDSLLQGAATAASWTYELLTYAKLQTRLKTATDYWLDLIGFDFFGASFLRRTGQGDESFRAKILANLFRERATRNGMIAVLTELTGKVPVIFEPVRSGDVGAYNVSAAYGITRYGSSSIPYQCFIDVSRDPETTLSSYGGYGSTPMAYGVTASSLNAYASGGLAQSLLIDADIYATIEATKPAGTICWTRISQ